MESGDSTAFVAETEVEPLVTKTLEAHLKDVTYNEKDVPTLTHYICEDIMVGLADLGKPFKYMVNCLIVQNSGAGYSVAVAEHGDALNDGVCTVRWPTEKSKTNGDCAAVVTVFGAAFFQ